MGGGSSGASRDGEKLTAYELGVGGRDRLDEFVRFHPVNAHRALAQRTLSGVVQVSVHADDRCETPGHDH